MMGLLKKQGYIWIVLSISLVFAALVLHSLYPLSIGQDPLILFSLLRLKIVLPFWLVIIVNCLNLYLIWWVVKITLNEKVALFTALIYGISPWSLYLAVGGSISVVILFSYLLLISSLVLLRQQKTILGYGLFIISIILSLSLSLFNWIIVPLSLLIISNIYSFKAKHQSLQIALIGCCLLVYLFLALNNVEGVQNIIKTSIALSPDSGVLNIINDFQGELIKYNLEEGRLIENRYIYFFLQYSENIFTHLSPLTYFTSRYPIVGESFTIPIYTGFIISFLYGLGSWRKIYQKHKSIFVVFLLLLLPSVLSLKTPDIGKLFIISPLIYITISQGIYQHLLHPQKRLVRVFQYIMIVLVVTQIMLFILDCFYKEPIRIAM